MPTEYEMLGPLPVKLYRESYGQTSRDRIYFAQRRKGFRAVFPDC